VASSAKALGSEDLEYEEYMSEKKKFQKKILYF